MKTEKKTEEKKEKKLSGKTKRLPGVNTFEEIDKLVESTPGVILGWSRDPVHKQNIRELVMAKLDFMKMRIAADNRHDSPTSTNPAYLAPDEMKLILLVGDRCREFEAQIDKALLYLLKQSQIGLWLLAQPGLRSGWLAAYVLGMFPDIYHQRICKACGKRGERDANMVFVHPIPPKLKDEDGTFKTSKDKCVHDGAVMDEENSYYKDRNPSSFVKFAGLHNVSGWACPVCQYNLYWSNRDKRWQHKKFAKHDGPKSCPHNGKAFGGTQSETPTAPNGAKAIPIKQSPRPMPEEKMEYNSTLRSKLLSNTGVADQLSKHHPKYKEIYEGAIERDKQLNPWRADNKGWLRQMGLRKVASRFVNDFFIEWRRTEGIPCRPPYEEEYLGVTHHSDQYK